MSYMHCNIVLVALVMCACPFSLLKVLLSHLSGGMIGLCGIWYSNDCITILGATKGTPLCKNSALYCNLCVYSWGPDMTHKSF